ncbi:hypothetical protein ACSBR2_019838 [Camellia fascicularis]
MNRAKTMSFWPLPQKKKKKFQKSKIKSMKRMTKAFQLSAKQVRVADRGRERGGERRRTQRQRHPAIGDCRRPTGVEQQRKKRRATKNHSVDEQYVYSNAIHVFCTYKLSSIA